MQKTFWSFSLKKQEQAPMPTREQLEQACINALPDFTWTFTVQELIGNPRDGFFRNIAFTATKGESRINDYIGVYDDFNEATITEHPEQSIFSVSSITPQIRSSEPQEIQNTWRAKLVAALLPLGFEERQSLS